MRTALRAPALPVLRRPTALAASVLLALAACASDPPAAPAARAAAAPRAVAAAYAPRADYRYTSGPGPLGVRRTGVGDWDWRMGTGDPRGAIHLVNARDGRHVCRVAEYRSLGPRVRCADLHGVPRDVEYQVLQLSRGRPGKRFGFAWADQPSRTTPYAPHPAYVYTSTGAGVTVNRIDTGTYTVKFLGLHSYPASSTSHVQVSAAGPGGGACMVKGWGDDVTPGAEGRVVVVWCTDQAGQPADSRFNVLLVE